METGITLKDKEANAWHNLKQKARRGGKRVLIDWSIALTEVQRNTLFPFSQVTHAAHFSSCLGGAKKVVVTNGNTAVQRQQMKAWREEQCLHRSSELESAQTQSSLI